MRAFSLQLFFLLALSLPPAKAVVKDAGGTVTLKTTAPTEADVAGWTTGWGAAGITGWDYVGTVNGGSGVYLGNGWVLTAGHVGAAPFVLNGTSYAVVSGSAQGVLNPGGTAADLALFRLTLWPNLPSLPIATAKPTAFSENSAGSSVVMIGYGGGQGETWGLNTVTQVDVPVQANGFTSTDFEVDFGTTTVGQGANTSSIRNDFRLVVGDSGGGDFIYDSAAARWTLAGINEALDDRNNGFLVQLSDYAAQINSVISVPEPTAAGLLACGVLALGRRFGRHGARRGGALVPSAVPGVPPGTRAYAGRSL
jgi:hypothetical protein